MFWRSQAQRLISLIFSTFFLTNPKNPENPLIFHTEYLTVFETNVGHFTHFSSPLLWKFSNFCVSFSSIFNPKKIRSMYVLAQWSAEAQGPVSLILRIISHIFHSILKILKKAQGLISLIFHPIFKNSKRNTVKRRD